MGTNRDEPTILDETQRSSECWTKRKNM